LGSSVFLLAAKKKKPGRDEIWIENMRGDCKTGASGAAADNGAIIRRAERSDFPPVARRLWSLRQLGQPPPVSRRVGGGDKKKRVARRAGAEDPPEQSAGGAAARAPGHGLIQVYFKMLLQSGFWEIVK
jgi:hypothetical protein